MFNISDFLKKFQTILLSETAVQEAVVNSVSKVLNFKISKESVKISDGVAFIKTSPLVKSEIFMKKEAILSQIAEILGNKTKIVEIK